MKLLRFLCLSLCSFVLFPSHAYQQEQEPLVIVNKAINQAAFIKGDNIIKVVDAASGKTEELTPEGLFTVIVKAKNPYYRKKDIEGGSPENPLGTRWIGFDARETDGRIYGIHGTNQSSSIGQYVTNGCIRLSNENVEWLYENAPKGTSVYIVKKDVPFQVLIEEVKILRHKN
ncbi:L,D-transpeptidase [Priestia endophytica]|uniref:L,D-transpeptidase n=1 Tax=Priestia endophytica TaxID=135735 RepID=A0AAX1QAU7_9BACI|nr:L,D-transpeptidase [Priestia endophytica]MCM3539520.1 L,D-transpeptidase [Priestia endophytica]RAS79276.1 L,D-transpeptidase [Priestia endophytica]RAS83949.1 L,D-transpeptidase [Priestia endophytica]